jgi:hypothetical protein
MTQKLTLIFNRIRKLLHEKYRFHYDQIELTNEFEKQLGTDS